MEISTSVCVKNSSLGCQITSVPDTPDVSIPDFLDSNTPSLKRIFSHFLSLTVYTVSQWLRYVVILLELFLYFYKF